MVGSQPKSSRFVATSSRGASGCNSVGFRPQSNRNSVATVGGRKSAKFRLQSDRDPAGVGVRPDRGRVSVGLWSGFGQIAVGFRPDRSRVSARIRPFPSDAERQGGPTGSGVGRGHYTFSLSRMSRAQ